MSTLNIPTHLPSLKPLLGRIGLHNQPETHHAELPYLDATKLRMVREERPLFDDPSCIDIKDPNISRNGELYTISYSQWDSLIEEGGMGLAASRHIHGPWIIEPRLQDKDGIWRSPVEVVDNNGNRVIAPQLCAPGVVGDEGGYHMIVQEACFEAGKDIIYANSEDGLNYQKVGTVLSPQGEQEALVYDPDDMHEVLEWDPVAKKTVNSVYITYSGAPRKGEPDIYVAKSISGTREGPWQRIARGDGKPGAVVTHAEVPFHNPLGSENYEWGLEGSQVRQIRVDLEGKHRRDLFLGVAVAFLAEGTNNLDKQRVFLMAARHPNGPYLPLGLLFEPPSTGWESGENGHASLYIGDEMEFGLPVKKVYVVYQARSKDLGQYNGWKPGLATIDYTELCETADHLLDTAKGPRSVIYRAMRRIVGERRKKSR